MMNRIKIYILSFLLTSLITLNGYAQEANGDRVGFSSLFTVVKADTQANATQYELNPNYCKQCNSVIPYEKIKNKLFIYKYLQSHADEK